VLVQDGVMRSYLHDEISARHYGVAPTGSGRRQSFRHPPLPRMRSTYMEPGPHDPAEIIASVDKGIYCETFANGQVQIGGGDFAFYVRFGWLIEGGKLTRPIKDVNLIGNGPKVLAAIDMVGNDLSDRRRRLDLRQGWPGGAGQPRDAHRQGREAVGRRWPMSRDLEALDLACRPVERCHCARRQTR
jgi:predicted Zn-dependent protease